MKTAVIFDLDGTLLDTLDDLHASVNHTLNKFGYPQRSRQEVRSFVGNGVPMLIKRSLPDGVGADEFTCALEYFKAHYKAHCMDNTRPYDGICDALSQLKSKGYSVGVVTNKVDNATQLLCQKHFLGLVDLALGQTEKFKVKPDPQSLFYLKECLGAEHVIYVGDSEVDIQTAQNGSVPCISVSWGFKDKYFLMSHGAAVIADNAEQMLDCIYKLSKDN